MSHIQVKISFDQEIIDASVVTALLLSEGFDSFEETKQGLLCYIPDSEWDKTSFETWIHTTMADRVKVLSCSSLPEKNWNELWESNFPAVTIAGKCLVRAPFHLPDPAFPLELVIEPKMSFGTAHHETTSQVMELMLEMDWKEKAVLDMGCGTGILAILAVKLGASQVLAVDNDTWAFENTLENIRRNKEMEKIEVKLGDVSLIGGELFDVIIANINRNILLRDIPSYAKSLAPEGIFILSGFYRDDLPDIQELASGLNFELKHYRSKNNWVAAIFKHLL